MNSITFHTICKIVSDNAETLKSMKSHDDLRIFGQKHGFTNPQAFGRYKAALKTIDVDYQLLRDKKYHVPSFIGPTKYRYSLASAYNENNYAITANDGTVLWHGTHKKKNVLQIDGVVDAARKSVWFTNKLRELSEIDAMSLQLMLDPLFVDERTGGNARLETLREYGRSLHILVEPIAVSREKNPAYPATKLQGWRRWDDNDLGKIAKCITKNIECNDIAVTN